MCLELTKLSKSFGAANILSDFSLRFPPSGTVALMGPSGCGKTTLLRLLLGLEQADSGEICNLPTKISMVFQEDRLLPEVSALGNLLAVFGKQQAPLAQSLLAAAGLSDAAHLLPRALSGGMRRRLSLIRALGFGGDLLLLDEPFAGLDDETRRAIYPLLEVPCNKAALTILITHDLDEAERLCDEIFFLDGAPLSIVSTQKRQAR